ncbi:hypothetical protein [Pseudomonas sp. nanlin1]|uniref:hypothetical protein n=1 Tax=Pseudomonas sp. nanlin1 TaxID=3040605 RepID=UPI00388F2C4A
MPQQRLDLLKLAKPVRDPIQKLVRSLEAASTREAIESEGAIALSFIGELEAGRKLRPADIEALYIIFDDAVQARMREFPAVG